MKILTFLIAGMIGPVAFGQRGPIPPGREPLQKSINQAIDRGVEYLIQAQNRDGSWGPVDGRLYEAHFDRRYGTSGLAVYTLLKSEVELQHPSVQRGLEYLLAGQPTKTYSIATQMLALGATRDERHAKRMDDLLDRLMKLQKRKKDNAWGYPGLNPNHVDLSNTQYAALGMRAAHEFGVKVPAKAWSTLVDTVLEFQPDVIKIDVESNGRSGTGKKEIAPFMYDRPRSGGTHAPSASMTAAGISILGIASEALGEGIGSAVARKILRGRNLGVGWLDHHFSVTNNHGGDAKWHYYYLYGLERVGSVFRLDKIGEHDWYWEGAEFLIKSQKPDGSWATDGNQNWPPAPQSNANTCFGLLFLTRATQKKPSSGRAQENRDDIHAAEDPSSEVWLRGSGKSAVTIWISGFGDGVIDEWSEDGGVVSGLRVHSVEYLVDGEPVERIEGDPSRGWQGDRFAFRHAFKTSGKHTIQARVHVLRPNASEENATAVLTSDVLEIDAGERLEDWMLAYARQGTENALSKRKPNASASSQLSGQWNAWQAIDGIEFSSWISSAEDAKPTITIELGRAVRASKIVLSQVNGSLLTMHDNARVERVRIHINKGKEPEEFDLDPDVLKKTECVLARPASIRRLQIEIISRTGGAKSQATGFAEIQLR